MKATRLLFIFLLLEQTTFPCAWTTGTKYNGERTEIGDKFAARRLRASIERNLSIDGVEMEKELRDAKSSDQRNDYAVALMYLGRSKEAVDLLQQLEQEEPGKYFTAANLGTAFELSGHNEEALRWIKEGLRRNPDSHSGTEWLHVKILEAKIAQQKDPHFFKKDSVLHLRPEEIGKTITIGDRTLKPPDLAHAIEYQLLERMRFVKPPDAAVASLLFDYAAINAITHSLESARKLLDMAVEYGYPTDQVKPLVALYNRRILWGKIRTYSVYAGIGLVGLGFLVFCYKRGWFVLSSRDLQRRGAA